MKAEGGERREIETLQLNRQAKNIFFSLMLYKNYFIVKTDSDSNVYVGGGKKRGRRNWKNNVCEGKFCMGV